MVSISRFFRERKDGGGRDLRGSIEYFFFHSKFRFLTHSTWLSIEIDLSRSAYSKAFSILFIKLETSYLDQMFPKLSRISG